MKTIVELSKDEFNQLLFHAISGLETEKILNEESGFILSNQKIELLNKYKEIYYEKQKT